MSTINETLESPRHSSPSHDDVTKVSVSILTAAMSGKMGVNSSQTRRAHDNHHILPLGTAVKLARRSPQPRDEDNKPEVSVLLAEAMSDMLLEENVHGLKAPRHHHNHRRHSAPPSSPRPPLHKLIRLPQDNDGNGASSFVMGEVSSQGVAADDWNSEEDIEYEDISDCYSTSSSGSSFSSVAGGSNPARGSDRNIFRGFKPARAAENGRPGTASSKTSWASRLVSRLSTPSPPPTPRDSTAKSMSSRLKVSNWLAKKSPSTSTCTTAMNSRCNSPTSLTLATNVVDNFLGRRPRLGRNQSDLFCH